MDTVYRMALPSDLPAVSGLLKASDLPFEDMAEHIENFIIALNGEKLAGCVGLEVHGDHGLLRSLAVDPGFRKHGIAQELCRRLYDTAKTKQIRMMHLLTNTAESFFLKQGFRVAERKETPPEIQHTTEFAVLCSDTSTYMFRYTDG